MCRGKSPTQTVSTLSHLFISFTVSTRLSCGVKARQNVSVAFGVIDDLVPLEKWDRDDVKTSLAQQTITEERHAVRCKRVADCRRVYPPEKVRRSVELDCYEGATREVHESIDRVETVENTRFHLDRETEAG